MGVGDKKNCILESRRFSNAKPRTEVIESTKLQSTLPINSLIKYLTAPIDKQLRYLTLAISRYTTSKGQDKEKMDIIDRYLTAELARLLSDAKGVMSKGGGTISSILLLSKYGSEINKLGVAMNRTLRRVNKQQEATGYIQKRDQELMRNDFSGLVEAFRKKYIKSQDNDLTELEITRAASSTESTKNYSSDNNEFTYYLNSDRVTDLDSVYNDIDGLAKDNGFDYSASFSDNKLVVDTSEMEEEDLNKLELIINKYK